MKRGDNLAQVRPRGRKPGTPNKVTGLQRHAIHEAFERLGGVESLVKFGEEHPKEFYGIWGKTIPSKVEGTGDGGAITIVVRRDD